jgi:hypothetical protein
MIKEFWWAGAVGLLFTGMFVPRTGDTRATPKSFDQPTFYKEVLPILQRHCEACHRAGGIAPMAFQTYEETRRFAEVIRLTAEKKSMPPWFAEKGIGKYSNDPSLSDGEIAALAAWAKANAPEGDPADAPPKRSWAERWTIPAPDLTVAMTEGVKIPADGEVDYTYEIVPTHFPEERWVQASEILPGMPENVHHAVVYVRPPGSSWLRHAPAGKPFTAAMLTSAEDRSDAMWTDSDILLVYAPGSTPDQWPTAMAKHIPAGSDLVFQMHYTTNGKAGTDTTRIGLIFSKEPPKQRVLTLQLTNDHFVIPPGVPDYRVEARGTLPNDALLLNFFPHMHLRGKRFEYNIVRADKSIEPLLRVNYHFHWQMSYRLTEPLALKAGTELQAVAWFDNSRANPHNPDPEAAVRWGEQTSDEMMVGFFDVAVEKGFDKERFFGKRSKEVSGEEEKGCGEDSQFGGAVTDVKAAVSRRTPDWPKGQGESSACAICKLTTKERVFRAHAEQCVKLRNWSSRSTYYCDYAITHRTSPSDERAARAATGTQDSSRRSLLAHRDVQDGGTANHPAGGDCPCGNVCAGARLDGGGYQQAEPRAGESGGGNSVGFADPGEICEPGRASAGEEGELGHVGGCKLPHHAR